MSQQELREDVAVLNVVNFGGGAYVLYAEVLPSGEIEVDPEPYSDTFDRPARLLPIEARALLAAIELLGVHLSEHLLTRAREARARARRHRQGGPARLQRAHRRRDRAPGRRGDRGQPPDRARVLRARTRTRSRPACAEPYALINSREGWYVARVRPGQGRDAHFRLDRIKRVDVLAETYEPRDDLDPIADVEGWQRTGEVEGSRVAHVWISPEHARWVAEERTVLAELDDGAIIVEWAFKGERYLVKRDPQGGRRRRGARARGRARARARRRRAASGTLPAVSRRDQIVMTRRRGGVVPGGGADRDLRDDRARRAAAPDAAVVRRPQRRSCGRGPTRSRRRCATSSATRAARCRSRPAPTTPSCAG